MGDFFVRSEGFMKIESFWRKEGAIRGVVMVEVTVVNV